MCFSECSDCHSCQSVVWWISVCSSDCWTVTVVRVICDGFLCVPVTVGL